MMKNILMILIAGLAIPLSAAGSIAADFMGVDIHGFISQGYLKTTENNFATDSKDGTFAFNEVGLNFGKELTDNLRVGVQLFARDFGDIGNHEIQIDWAYADYRFNDLLGFRFGQIKIPHGLYNETRDVDVLRNPIFLPQSVYQEVSRNVYLSLQGVGFYGYLDFSSWGGVSYQAMYGGQQIGQSNKVSEHLIGIPSDIIASDSFDVDYKYAGSLVWEAPLSGLRIGSSVDNTTVDIYSRFTREISYTIPGRPTVVLAQEGELSTIHYDKLLNVVLSAEYTWDNLILMGEYIHTYKNYDIHAFYQQDGTQQLEHIENELTGWYAGGAYRFADWFELGAYYSQTRNEEPHMSPHPIAPDFYDKLDDICVTTRFDINEYLTLKLEAHSIKGAYGLSSWDNPTNAAGDSFTNFEEEWKMFAAKLTAAF